MPIKPHAFRPDPATTGWCACGLPQVNQAMHVDPPSVPDISEARRRPASLPAPAQPGSATSVQAALHIGPSLGEWQMTVLRAFGEAGIRGLTDEELARGLDPDRQNTIRPRRVELVDSGLVRPLLDNYGHEVTRRNRSGRQAKVYVLTADGRGLV